MPLNQKQITFLIFVLLGVAALLHLIDYYTAATFPPKVLIASRWITWLLLVIYAFNKKSLTTWILVSMVLGVEIGLNFHCVCTEPAGAQQAVPAPDQNHYRSHPFLNAGGRHCRTLQPESRSDAWAGNPLYTLRSLRRWHW